jgi:hypothetical protein
MANSNKAFGFSPWRNGDGSPWNGQANVYYIYSSDSTNYFIGDPVISAAQMDANGVPGCAIATGTSTVRGVIVGFLNPGPSTSLQGTSLTLESVRGAASTTRYALVADDPNIIFKCQMDNATLGNSNTIASAANKNCSFTVNSQTTSGYLSNAVLSGTTVHTTQGLNVKLLGLVNGTENAGITDTTVTVGAYSVWQCKFNEHELQGNTAAI